jgi:hypothetical protein
MSDNETETRIASQLLRAALAQFDAERHNALATLDLYLHRSTAIGDHPNVVEEVIKATRDLAAAEESIEALERNFLSNTSPFPDSADAE